MLRLRHYLPASWGRNVKVLKHSRISSKSKSSGCERRSERFTTSRAALHCLLNSIIYCYMYCTYLGLAPIQGQGCILFQAKNSRIAMPVNLKEANGLSELFLPMLIRPGCAACELNSLAAGILQWVQPGGFVISPGRAARSSVSTMMQVPDQAGKVGEWR